MTARQLHRASIPWGAGAASLFDALAAHMDDLKWQDDAACRDVGGDAWFPEQRVTAPMAKAICEGCPVRNECLEDALARHDQHGIWGGYTVEERWEIQRQRMEVAA